MALRAAFLALLVSACLARQEPSLEQHQYRAAERWLRAEPRRPPIMAPPWRKRDGRSPQDIPSDLASQLMQRSPRGHRQYDVPQIECPQSTDGVDRYACPTPDRMGRYRCIDDHVLCDGFIDCPNGEDEDRQSCMFYKTMIMLPPDPLFVIQKDLTSVMCLTLTDDRSSICCGTVTGDVFGYDLETYCRNFQFKNSEESILSVNEVPSLSDSLLVQDKAGTIRHWSSNEGDWKKLHEITLDFVGFCRICVSADKLIVPFSQGRIKIFTLPDFQEDSLYMLAEGKSAGEVMALCAFERSSKKYIIAAMESGLIAVLDFDNGERLSSEFKVSDCPMAIDFDSLSMKGVIGTSTSQLTVFSLSSDMSLSLHRTVEINSEGVACVGIRGDRKLLAVGCWDGRLRLLSWKSFVTLAVLDTHLQTINCVAFTSQAPYIMAAGCKEGRVSIWDIYNGKR